jgi:hypothetical protein
MRRVPIGQESTNPWRNPRPKDAQTMYGIFTRASIASIATIVGYAQPA